MNRCLNDIFGYCAGKPKLVGKLVPYEFEGLTGVQQVQMDTLYTCARDKRTYRCYRTFTQTLAIVTGQPK